MTMSITKGETAKQLAEAITSGEGIEPAFAALMDEIAERVRADYADVQEQKDYAILASRGYRTLTSAEEKFYNGMTAALKSANPQQAFADFIGAEVMPETIYESIINEIEAEHPLLNAIEFLYVGYGTKVPRNIAGMAKAVWGSITDAISKELTGGVDTIDLTQNKLSAYVLIPLDILDMGPRFIDMLVRAALTEAIYNGLEDGIINGTGIKSPVGMIRDVHRGVTIDTTDGYPAKTALVVNDLREETIGAVIAEMAVNEFGADRSFDQVYAVMNLKTALTKWRPAIPKGPNGKELSFPVEEIISALVPANKVVLFIPRGYVFGVGGSRNGLIAFSDEFKFLDDVRTFKVIQHGDGIAVDNTACVVLDVSGMRPFVQRIIDVKNDGAVLVSYGITISGTDYWFDINEAAHTATLEVPYGTSLSSLVGNFVLSDGATAKIGSTGQTSGTTSNTWTDGTAKNFKVTSEDGAVTATYAMTINVAEQAEE